MASVVRWRWSDHVEGHFAVQCEHMVAKWARMENPPDPEDFPWATLPLHPTTGWVIVQKDPLTVTPSILLSDCGCHGFITNGEWVSC